ncbi:hypothetical protein [Amphritea japonica]|uniref:hypothetical protein n=1 Tax=Amphritea japonica TaxID=452627 RepID=UPI000362C9B1|nr:hypothetical protein [Amphritea japonica]
MNTKLLTGIALSLAMISSSAFSANSMLNDPYSTHVINNSKVNSSYGIHSSEMRSSSNQHVDKAVSFDKAASSWGWDADSSK